MRTSPSSGPCCGSRPGALGPHPVPAALARARGNYRLSNMLKSVQLCLRCSRCLHCLMRREGQTRPRERGLGGAATPPPAHSPSSHLTPNGFTLLLPRAPAALRPCPPSSAFWNMLTSAKGPLHPLFLSGVLVPHICPCESPPGARRARRAGGCILGCPAQRPLSTTGVGRSLGAPNPAGDTSLVPPTGRRRLTAQRRGPAV